MTNYQKDIRFVESLINIPRQNYMLGLRDRSHFIGRTKKFLSLVGNPQNKLKFVHVAGTSGKGTTVKLLESLMADAGHKTGSFTSPFATTSIEKVSINNKLLPPRELHKIIEKYIKPALDKYTTSTKDDIVSYFEIWLAIAMLYFAKQKCNWVVLEAGLGGLHDATNVIPAPKVAAITNIGMDHTDILGNTKQAIATDKAGIIKRNSIFLTTEKNKKLLKIFEKTCRTKQAWLMQTENLVKDYNTDNYFKTKKQQQNLNLALNILDVLKIEPKNPQQVINKFKLICRQEIIQKNPIVILDGSHNKDKLDNLIDFVKQQNYKKLHLVLAFGFDKSYTVPLKKLLAVSNNVYLTRYLIGKKTADLRKLYHTSKKLRPHLPVNVYNDPYQALDSALKSAKKDDLVLITGSFYLSGELRKKWVPEDYILKSLKLDRK